MLQKKLLTISFLTILSILIFHYFALRYSWYWTIRWLDTPVHIVGGFWVSVTALWVSLKSGYIKDIRGYKSKTLLAMLISVLIVAVFWEIFELVFKITSLNSVGYWQDTLGDIFNTFIGGVVVFIYFVRNKKVKHLVANNNLKMDFIVVL